MPTPAIRTARPHEQGFVLVAALSLLVVLMLIGSTYATLSINEMRNTSANSLSASAFFAAEGGLNMRAEAIRARFVGYSRPVGTSPTNSKPCVGSNMGSGDLACVTYQVGDHQVETYVIAGAVQTNRTVPAGEKYAGLSAQEYAYDVYSRSVSRTGDTEALVRMTFQSRLIPLFQFAAFYSGDLETSPGAPMVLNGRVHSNGSLYINNQLTISGETTTAQNLYHNRKYMDQCQTPTRVNDPGTPRDLPCIGRRAFREDELKPWNGQVKINQEALTIPSPETTNPRPGNAYWDNADLRVMLNLRVSPARIELRDSSGLTMAGSASVTSSMGLSMSQTFVDNRENGGRGLNKNTRKTLLEVDMATLLNKLKSTPTLIGGKALSNGAQGGLVMYFGVDATDAGNACTPSSTLGCADNLYGVRVRNGAELKGGGEAVKGLTLVTNQAMIVQGDYNSVNRKPASLIADTFNVLSNAWNSSKESTYVRGTTLPNALSTTINAAVLSGTDETVGTDYSGGLENYPRMHEAWSGQTLAYRGSFVSLGVPQRSSGRYADMTYNIPKRDFGYDTLFDDADSLPPLTPRAVYLKQQLFARDFQQP